MNLDQLPAFVKWLSSVKRASTRYGPAPHKPVLLLTFLEMVDSGLLPENRVCHSRVKHRKPEGAAISMVSKLGEKNDL